MLDQKPKTEQKLTGKQPWFTCRNKHTKEFTKDLLKYMQSDDCNRNRSRTEIDYRTRVFLDPHGDLCKQYSALVKRSFRNYHPEVSEEELHVALDDPFELVKSGNPEVLSGVHVLEQFDERRVTRFAEASNVPGGPESSTKSSNLHTDSGGGGAIVWSTLLYATECTMPSMPASLRAPAADLFAEMIQAEEGVVTNATLAQAAHGMK